MPRVVVSEAVLEAVMIRYSPHTKFVLLSAVLFSGQPEMHSFGGSLAKTGQQVVPPSLEQPPWPIP